jgi:tRNA dimethylallyltransferase
MAKALKPEQPILALTGPTASGKSAAALALARAFAATKPVEIISVDSAQVYRGMDIGTAKPGAAERAEVVHHLIDIRDPLQAYSAAQFAADATELIAQIVARGHLPLLVGGTMLYFKALFDGLDDMPAADPAIRAELEQEAANRGWPALHAELAKVDPVTAARLHSSDSQRIARALEVYRITGQPMSTFHTSKNELSSDLAQRCRLISLEPTDRAWLHERIAQRFESMLDGGLLTEVQALRARDDLSPDLPSMRCVGYRQAWEFLDAHPDGASSRALINELRDKGVFATRQLAKRQITWLRAMRERCVVASEAADAQEQVLALAREWVAT